MSGADQKQFTDAVAKAKADQGFFGGTNYDDWTAALQACNRLAMLDLLPALESMDPRDVIQLQTVEAQKNVIGERGAKRIWFARTVVWSREIEDQGLPDDQVNDAREFLGCTRLDVGGVQQRTEDVQDGGRYMEQADVVQDLILTSACAREAKKTTLAFRSAGQDHKYRIFATDFDYFAEHSVR